MILSLKGKKTARQPLTKWPHDREMLRVMRPVLGLHRDFGHTNRYKIDQCVCVCVCVCFYLIFSPGCVPPVTIFGIFASLPRLSLIPLSFKVSSGTRENISGKFLTMDEK